MDDDYGADDELLAAMAAADPAPVARPTPPKIQQPTPQRLDKAPPSSASSAGKVVQPTPKLYLKNNLDQLSWYRPVSEEIPS
ncbi:hypothetical protein SNK04_010268 [Fusarium graminearum]